MAASEVSSARVEGGDEPKESTGEARALSTAEGKQAMDRRRSRARGGVKGKSGWAATTDGADQGGDAVLFRRSTLPTELIDYVLSFVADFGYPWASASLARCSLASRTFRALAHPRLYRHIDLSISCVSMEGVTGGSELYAVVNPAVFSLYHTLVDRPALATLVQQLDIDTPVESPEEVQFAWGATVEKERLEDWLHAKRINVPLLLSSLPSLRTLVLGECHHGGHCADYPVHIPLYLRGAHIPSLRHLDSPTIVPEIFGAAPNLDSLEAPCHMFKYELPGWDPATLAVEPSPSLKELRVDAPPTLQAAAIWAWLAPGSYATLETLDMSWEHHFIPRLSHFTALEALSLDLSLLPGALVEAMSALEHLPSSLGRLTLLHDNFWGFGEPPLRLSLFLHLPRALTHLTLTDDLIALDVLLDAITEQRRGSALPALRELRIKDCQERSEIWRERERLIEGFKGNGTVCLVERWHRRW
ncbi:hypothetical protein JCM10213_003820 [Rhodosporidiobolus nylandii]